MVTAGTVDVVHWNLVLEKVVEPSVVVPLLGFGLAAMLSLLMAGAIGRRLDGHPRPMRAARSSSPAASSPSRTARTTRRRRWA